MREKILKEKIFIDHNRYYDSDDFPHFCFSIEDFHIINGIADGIRSDAGKIPFFDYEHEYDDEGWYDFFVACDYKDGKLTNTKLFFRVENASLSDDTQKHYEIELDDDEKEAIAEVIWDEMHEYIESAMRNMEEENVT